MNKNRQSIPRLFRISIIASITLGVLIILSLLVLSFNKVPENYERRLHLAFGAVGMLVLLLFSIDRFLILPLKKLRSNLPQTNQLITLFETLNQNKTFKEILDNIFTTFKPYIPFVHIGIALIEDKGSSIRGAYGVSDPIIEWKSPELMGVKVLIEETSLREIANTGNPRIINDLEKYINCKPLKEYNRIIFDAGIRSSITLPLKISNNPVGFIFFSSNRKNVYTSEHTNFLKALANSIALSLEKDIVFNELLYSSVLAMAKLAESRDTETGEHLQRMKSYTRKIAELLHSDSIYRNQIDTDFIENIEKFSPLHDVGKVAIRDDILLKPGKLTAEEFEIMKTHTVYGAKVLKTAENNISKYGRSLFKMGIEIVEGHHEKWDGTGYPNGWKGHEIPLSARIVALADVFDALTSSRVYKNAYSFSTGYEMIENGSGRHFDPEIVDVFVRHRIQIEEIYNSFYNDIRNENIDIKDEAS